MVNAKVDSQVNALSLIGPLFVILPILLVIVKESSFYIDLGLLALVGLLVCWRFRLKGLIFASLLLYLLLSYDFFFREPNFWKFGLGASLQLTFLITSLASVELKEAFQAARAELEEWKSKISALLQNKEALAQENETLKAKLLPLQDGIKERSEKAEMFEHLLEMARNQLIEETSKRHHFEEQYLHVKNAHSLLEGESKEERKILRALCHKLEGELKTANLLLHDKENHSQKLASTLMDAELQIKSVQEANDKEQGKVHALGEQMEALIDRLKNLQTEKEDLEKKLAATLNESAPDKESRELKRVWGLHGQLRSQFEEKSRLLDQTRSELFHTKEELLLFQKMAAEEQEEIYQAFEDHILALEQEIQYLESISEK